MPADKRPDVILVKKQFAEKGFRNRQRKWKLHRLEREAAMSANSNERLVYINERYDNRSLSKTL